MGNNNIRIVLIIEGSESEKGNMMMAADRE